MRHPRAAAERHRAALAIGQLSVPAPHRRTWPLAACLLVLSCMLAGGCGAGGQAAGDASPGASDVPDGQGDKDVNGQPDVSPGVDSQVGPHGDAPVSDAQPTDSAASVDGGADGLMDGHALSDATASGSDASVGDPTETSDGGAMCTPGASRCAGVRIEMCTSGSWGPAKPCPAGQGCLNGNCVAVAPNVVLVVDTSGSMGKQPVALPGCPTVDVWPGCANSQGCTSMAVVKKGIAQAVQAAQTPMRLAMFRFRQRVSVKPAPYCGSGYYSGVSSSSGGRAGPAGGDQSVDASASWYWAHLHEALCVRTPPTAGWPSKAKIMAWLDGTEAISKVGACAQSTTSTCETVAGCAGGCCDGACMVHTDPELRVTGGSPIGETLFWVGEYLRNAVVVSGRACQADADCDQIDHACIKAPAASAGTCQDPLRACRETVVVLITDGGQVSTKSFASPLVQAKRLGRGLCCASDADCVGGTEQLPTVCSAGVCQPKAAVTGHHCRPTMAPCLPDATETSQLYCSGTCVKDPSPGLTTCAKQLTHNIQRAPDGKPFGVTLRVVDVASTGSATMAFQLAQAAGGSYYAADLKQPDTVAKAVVAAMAPPVPKVCQ